MLAKMAQECIFTKARGCSKCVPRTSTKYCKCILPSHFSSPGWIGISFSFSFEEIPSLSCVLTMLPVILSTEKAALPSFTSPSFSTFVGTLSLRCSFFGSSIPYPKTRFTRFRIELQEVQKWPFVFKNDDLFSKINRLRIMMFDNGTTRAFCINRGLQISSQSAFLKKVFARYIFKLIHAR